MNHILATCRDSGVIITGELLACESFALTKMKRKPVAKFENNKSGILGEKVYVDTSSVNNASLGKRKFWLLMVDQATKHK